MNGHIKEALGVWRLKRKLKQTKVKKNILNIDDAAKMKKISEQIKNMSR